MTCVWNSLMRNIKKDNITLQTLGQYRTAIDFVKSLKRKNRMIEGMKWQGAVVGKKQQQENYDWIKEYNERLIGNGHMTSSADPFIMLVAHLLSIQVILTLNGHRIVITPPGRVRYTIQMRGSRGHMQ